MKLLPSFKPPVRFRELNRMLLDCSPVHGCEHPEADDFLKAFSSYIGGGHAIDVSAARWGLYYLLKSMGFAEGDEVIVPAFSYFAVPSAVIKAGLRPVFADVGKNSILIDPDALEACITPRTRAVIPTHLCGFSCAMDRITDIARRHGLKVIEDCAQSVGAEFDGTRLGAFGDAAYFTFNVTKSMTTLGGSVLIVRDEHLMREVRRHVETVRTAARRTTCREIAKAYIMKGATSPLLFPAVYAGLRSFSLFDIDIVERIFKERSFFLPHPPTEGRLNGLQARLGLSQLQDIDRRNRIRETNGTYLYERLRAVPGIRVPRLTENARNVFSGCPVMVRDKTEFRKLLLARGIDTSAGYMQDCSRSQPFAAYAKHCPNAAKAEGSILYLPSYDSLTRKDLDCIATRCAEAARRTQT